MSFFPNLFGSPSVDELEAKKQTAIEDFDAKIAAAREKEASTNASQPGPGTAPMGGRRRGSRKTKRSKKGKSKRSRTGRKSSRL